MLNAVEQLNVCFTIALTEQQTRVQYSAVYLMPMQMLSNTIISCMHLPIFTVEIANILPLHVCKKSFKSVSGVIGIRKENHKSALHGTCDGVMREGLYVGQVVVRTVFLKPLADVLLSPQHHGFGQAGQRWTGVVHSEGFTWTQLKHTESRGR